MASSTSNNDTDRTPRAVRGVKKELGGFKKFLLRGNVVDLAVGVVIGAAFGNVVQSLVDNFINPLVGVFGGGQKLTSWTIPVAGATINIGAILNALISFVLIAAVVYFLVVLPVNKLMDRYRPEPKPSPTKECPECLSDPAGCSALPGVRRAAGPALGGGRRRDAPGCRAVGGRDRGSGCAGAARAVGRRALAWRSLMIFDNQAR